MHVVARPSWRPTGTSNETRALGDPTSTWWREAVTTSGGRTDLSEGADRFVRGPRGQGGQIRPGAKGTGRTDSSAITETPESYPRRSFAFRGGSRGSAKSPTEPERSKDKRGRPLWQSLEALAEAVAARTNG